MDKTTTIRLSAALAGAIGLLAAPHAAIAEGDAVNGAPNIEVGIGVGAMHVSGGVDGIDDTGPAFNADIRIGLDSFPLSFEARVLGGAFSIDDGQYFFEDEDYANVYLRDADYSFVCGDVALLLNLNRDGEVNPYIGGGVMWGVASVDGDVYYTLPGWRGHSDLLLHEEDENVWDEDGATFIARAGVDFRMEGLFVRLDVGYLGELFDDDDEGQFILYGDVGVPFSDKCRADIFGHYLTDYECLAVGVGVTLTL